MPNRTVCNVLDEMRKCGETHNYSYLPGLIEEVQTMVNRMEEALWDQNDYKHAYKKYKQLKEKLAKLKEEIKDAENK